MDDFKILLQSALDKAKSKANINADIKDLQNQVSKVKIKAELDSISLKTLMKQIESATKQKSVSGGYSGSTIGNQIFNTKDLDAQGKVYFQKVNNTIKKMSGQIETKFKGLGFKNIDVSGIEKANGMIKEFTVTASTAEGIIKKFKFERQNLLGNGKTQAGFVQSDDIKVIDKTAAAAAKLAREEEVTAKQIAKSEAKITAAKERAAQAQAQILAKRNGDIQYDIDTGAYQLKIDTIRRQYEKWGYSADDVKNKLTELDSAYATMVSAPSEDERIRREKEFQKVLETTKNAQRSTALENANPSDKLNLSNKIQIWLDKNSRASQSAKNELLSYITTLRSSDDLAAPALDNIKQKFTEIEIQERAAGRLGMSWSDTFKASATKFKDWVIASGAVMHAINKVNASVTELKEINSILTEISKTSDLTTMQLEKLGDTSFETASVYGKKASGYLTGIQEMYRAGYENAEQLAELSVLAQAAGDMDAELANDYLIASDAAYGYGGNIEKLTALLDGQNQVTNRNAVSMQELANATKVAGSMLSNVANIPENKMTALLGTGIATSRESGETVARAVKSIIMNLQQVEGEGGFDGEIIDEEQLKKVEARCHGVGVELEYMKDGIVSLRDPMEVLRELSEVYNSLPKDSAERAGIISDIGGKYRANVLSSILSNFDKYEKMLGDYENSAGSAMNEAMKSANNWDGSLNRLNNTFTDIIGNVANSDVIIATINNLNSLLEIINKLTSALGSLGTIGVIGGGYLGAKGLRLTNYVTYHSLQVPFYKAA